MNLRKSIKRVASFLRVGVDFERIKSLYQENPEDMLLRSAYIRECNRRNEEPTIYLDWVKREYDVELEIDAEKWNLYSKGIKDLKFLSGLNAPNLLILFLQTNQIGSLEGLSGFNAPNLQTLYLHKNQIKSLKGLSGFNAPNLQALYLDSNEISSLKGLEGVKAPNLKSVYLESNKISSLEELERVKGFNAPNLRLFLSSNPIKSLSEEDQERYRFIVI